MRDPIRSDPSPLDLYYETHGRTMMGSGFQYYGTIRVMQNGSYRTHGTGFRIVRNR